MFSGLLIILVPLIVGYLIPLRQKAALRVINQLLSWMVYLILFLWVSVWRFSITSPVTCWQFCIILPSVLPLFYCVILPP